MTENYEEIYSRYRGPSVDSTDTGLYNKLENIQSAIAHTFHGMDRDLSQRRVRLVKKTRVIEAPGIFLAQIDAIVLRIATSRHQYCTAAH